MRGDYQRVSALSATSAEREGQLPDPCTPYDPGRSSEIFKPRRSAKQSHPLMAAIAYGDIPAR